MVYTASTFDNHDKGADMKEIFEEMNINGLELKNRLVRSATWEGMCDEGGCPTQKHIDWNSDLARGGIGLIISGYTFVRREGKQLPGKMGLIDNTCAQKMKALTSSIHRAGGKICLQLVHAGGQTDTKNAGTTPLAPSAIELEQYPEIPQELSLEEIKEIVTAFGESARRAKEYGFDAIQLHGAHGYLINQFLSPLTNRRTDDYGGSPENRNRFFLDICREVRSQVGDSFPILVKINCSDFLEGGITPEESIQTAILLDKQGIDAIEISGGTTASEKKSPARMNITKPEDEAYHLTYAAAIKKSVNCPIMVVGGFRSLEIIQKALNKYDLDYVSLARPLIREPNLPKRWKEGNRTPASCISCNGCFEPGLTEGGIYCILEKKEPQ